MLIDTVDRDAVRRLVVALSGDADELTDQMAAHNRRRDKMSRELALIDEVQRCLEPLDRLVMLYGIDVTRDYDGLRALKENISDKRARAIRMSDEVGNKSATLASDADVLIKWLRTGDFADEAEEVLAKYADSLV